jgi:hypothetical protein
MISSDESHSERRMGNQGWHWNRSKGFDRFDPKFTRKLIKHPPKIMAWACFSWRGRGRLEFLKPGEMPLQLQESHSTNLEQLREEIKRLWVLRMEDS